MATVVELAVAKLNAAGLGPVTYTPDHELYDARIQSYWTARAKLKPWAIVQPRNAGEVSKAVRALVGTPGCNFAVRSGGHMVWAGSNNIKDGITIDLGLMAEVTCDGDAQTVSIGPGGKWIDVYKEVEKRGKMVAGSREGNVGVGGFLTGGGNSFYTCRLGFACDQVVEYEVVLADGRIVIANGHTNTDLFRVLKGGGNNFGIVTRFDVKSFPFKAVWDGNNTLPKEATPQVLDALIHFVGNISAQPDSHTYALFMYLPQIQDYLVILDLTSLDGEENCGSLQELLNLPGKLEMNMTTIATKMKNSSLPSEREIAWFTLTFKADRRVAERSTKNFETLVKTLQDDIPDGKFISYMFLQPLPASFGQLSTANGGNMFDLGRIQDDCVLLMWGVELDTPELMSVSGYPALKKAIEDTESYAESLDANVDFRYPNYCDISQDPLGTFGEENIKKMREAAAKYDPNGVFQTRVPGGFKISNVK